MEFRIYSKRKPESMPINRATKKDHNINGCHGFHWSIELNTIKDLVRLIRELREDVVISMYGISENGLDIEILDD